MSAVLARAVAVVAAVLLTAGCTSSGSDDPPAASPSPAESTATAPPEPEQPRPKTGQCHRLSPRTAVAPTHPARPVACRRNHTAQTFFVGTLDLSPGGTPVSIDAPEVQRQMAATCPKRLLRHLKITPKELRLTMARAIWFTPTVEDAAAGADWFRCDLVVVAAPDVLMRLPRRTAGSGDLPGFAMCATAEPGTKQFRRVACARKHAWTAIATVDLPGKALPNPQAASARMEPACRDAAREHADDPLAFRWSEERPTKQQWRAGQRYGICWVPAG